MARPGIDVLAINNDLAPFTPNAPASHHCSRVPPRQRGATTGLRHHRRWCGRVCWLSVRRQGAALSPRPSGASRRSAVQRHGQAGGVAFPQARRSAAAAERPAASGNGACATTPRPLRTDHDPQLRHDRVTLASLTGLCGSDLTGASRSAVDFLDIDFADMAGSRR